MAKPLHSCRSGVVARCLFAESKLCRKRCSGPKQRLLELAPRFERQLHLAGIELVDRLCLTSSVGARGLLNAADGMHSKTP